MRFALVALCVACLTVGVLAPASAPVQVTYVYSGSMEPAIATGDGFVVVPPTAVERGDIVVYEATREDELVTHRVVSETAAGFVTKGDANHATDQERGEPPVQRDAIVGEVLTVDGAPLVVPRLGALLQLADLPLLAGATVLGAWRYVES
ncbi:signal peptidase I [Haladaptatus sp. GCM10025707]|uniref:signal peptidase I n=1 Tax=unclassified Haladaptatus TaxID=2622732 RepID=UPI0023E798BD|nr:MULTISPECIES: signal peptidase I [unclassified Haladaptatus]